MKRSILLIGIAMAAVAFAAVVEPVDLSRRPTEGSEMSYELVVSFDMTGMPIEVTGSVTDKVTKVNEDGSYTITTSESNLVAHVDGQELPAGPDSTSSTTFAKDGKILKIESEMLGAEVWRMAELSNFHAPKGGVEVGAKWTATSEGVEANGTVDVKHTYKLVAVEEIEGRQTGKVAFEAVEQSGSDPASTNGFAWVDLKTGALVRLEAEMLNAPMPGMGPTDLNVRIELAE